MATKTITIRVPETTAEFLSQKFDNQTSGAQSCIEVVRQMNVDNNFEIDSLVDNMNFLSYIRSYSKREIKGKFTAEEWCYLADSLNGTIITPEFRCNSSALIVSIEDSNDFDNLSEKWDVNVELLSNKVKELTGAQVDAVYTHVEALWSNDERSLEIWSNELI